MARLLASMHSQEAAEWLASIRLDPPEAERADIRHALLMDLLVKLLGGKQKRKIEPMDFFEALPWRQPERVPEPKSLPQKIDAVMAMLGGVKS